MLFGTPGIPTASGYGRVWKRPNGVAKFPTGARIETEPATSCCPSYQLLCGLLGSISGASTEGLYIGCHAGVQIPSIKLAVSGPQLGRFRIGCTIQSGNRDCSRLEKPKFQEKSCGFMTSPTRNASDSPQVTIWRPMNSVRGP